MTEKTLAVQKDQNQDTALTREEQRYLVPPVDIYENEEGLTVVADMPGVTREAVTVNVENGILTIEGRPQHEKQGEQLFREFELAPFYRRFELSDRVDQEKIKAALKNGVLTIELPKAEAAKPRQIKVQTK